VWRRGLPRLARTSPASTRLPPTQVVHGTRHTHCATVVRWRHCLPRIGWSSVRAHPRRGNDTAILNADRDPHLPRRGRNDGAFAGRISGSSLLLARVGPSPRSTLFPCAQLLAIHFHDFDANHFIPHQPDKVHIFGRLTVDPFLRSQCRHLSRGSFSAHARGNRSPSHDSCLPAHHDS